MRKLLALFAVFGAVCFAQSASAQTATVTTSLRVNDIEFRYFYSDTDIRPSVSVDFSSEIYLVEEHYTASSQKYTVYNMVGTRFRNTTYINNFVTAGLWSEDRKRDVNATIYASPRISVDFGRGVEFFSFTKDESEAEDVINRPARTGLLSEWRLSVKYHNPVIVSVTVRSVSVTLTQLITVSQSPVITRLDYRRQYKSRLFANHFADNDYFRAIHGNFETADACWARLQARQSDGDTLKLQPYNIAPNAHSKCFAERYNKRAQWNSTLVYEHLFYVFGNCLADSFGRGRIYTPFERVEGLARDLRGAVMYKQPSSFTNSYVYKYRAGKSPATVDRVCDFLKRSDFQGRMPGSLTANDIILQANA